MNTASNPNPTIVTFTEFKTQVMTGQLLSVTLYPDCIDYQLKGQFGVTYRTVVKDENRDDLQVVTNALRQQGVPFKAAIDSANPPSVLGGIVSLLLSAGLAAGTWWWLSKFVEDNGSGSDIGNSFGNGFGNGFSNPMGMGRSKARTYADGKSTQKITFADVAGINEAKQELQEIVDFLKDGEKYRKIGAKIPKGVLLVGPPGTGKTLLAKAIAGEAGVPFLSMAGSEFVELYVGVGASRVRDLFQKAKRQAPCIIFIDEIDAIGKSRNNNPGGNDEREQTLNQLLTEMDGFDGNAGVILVAATNRPEILDAALKRPGRFDRQVLVDRPDKLGRLEILKVHAQSVLLGEDVDLETIATQTAGFVGADLANLINESALLAARYNRQAVLMQDVQAAIERVIAGLENRSRILSPIERQTVAYHEVGHAIVGAAVTGGGRVTKISIVPRGAGALGYTLQMPEEDRFLMMEDELQGRIATLLGGRSAEELIFGQVSTGASDDIQKATDLAERAITQYGMSKTLGPIAFEKTQGQFLDQGTIRRNVSNEVSAEIDRLVKQTIDQAHQRAQAILTTNRELLESTTQLLLKEEVLEGDRLAEILASVVR